MNEELKLLLLSDSELELLRSRIEYIRNQKETLGGDCSEEDYLLRLLGNALNEDEYVKEVKEDFLGDMSKLFEKHEIEVPETVPEKVEQEEKIYEPYQERGFPRIIVFGAIIVIIIVIFMLVLGINPLASFNVTGG